MGDFKFDHEKTSKNLKVLNIDDHIDDINIDKPRKNDYNDFFINEVEPETDTIGLDFLANDSKKVEQDQEDSDTSEKYDRGNDNFAHSDNAYSDIISTRGGKDYVEMSFEEIQSQKATYLSYLRRFEKRGIYMTRRYGPEHSLDDIKGEYLRIQRDIELDTGIGFLQTGLSLFVQGVELGTHKYQPFGIDMKGWGDVMYHSRHDYDDVLGELYTKYVGPQGLSPEAKLISMVGGSAFSFYMQKKLVDTMASNPEGMQKMFNSFMASNGNSIKHEMKGPSVDTDELLRKLQEDDFSDISSEKNSVISIESVKKTPAKRGRKPKNK